MSHLQTVYSERMEAYDSETGELIDGDSKVITKIVGKDEFYLTYTYLINVFIKDMTLNEIKVFSYFLQHYKVESTIAVNKYIKEQICKEAGIKNTKSVDNALRTLQQKKYPLLYKQSRGTYKINPRYAFKGNSKDRDKHLKAIIELGCKDC